MIDLYLLRHAVAAERGLPAYPQDSERPLTPDGEKRMRRAAEGMKEFGLSFDVILSSPYLRAKQTAEVVARVFKCSDKLAFSPNLAPDGDPKQLIEAINMREKSLKSVLLVGHEPCMSELVSVLTTGSPTGMTVIMKKGGLCKLVADTLSYERCATLEWLLTPRQLTLME